jgi:hypothetical protein
MGGYVRQENLNILADNDNLHQNIILTKAVESK